MSQRFLLGKIATAHGIRGLVKVLVTSEDPMRLETCGPAYTAENGGQELRLTMKNSMGKYWLAEVEGVSDRNGAEALRHTELWYDRDKLPEPDEDEVYYADLIEKRVVTEDGEEIGFVIAVDNFGASDLLEIQPPQGASFYLPYTDDTIKAMDDDSITVFIPEGLRE